MHHSGMETNSVATFDFCHSFQELPQLRLVHADCRYIIG